MAVLPRLYLMNKNQDKCSIGLASALFDMPDAQFVNQYIKTGKCHADKLHQVSWSRVLWLYDQTPDRKKQRAIALWRMNKAFDL